MSLFKKIVLSAAAAIALSSAVSAATTLNVFIKDQSGNAVGDVTVAAIEFGQNGPTSNSQMAVTPNTGVTKGTVTLTLADNKNYMVMYSTHGYTPSLADQFNNPEYNPAKYVWADGVARNSIFTVTSGLTGVGKLRLEFANATANTLLFGGVYNMKSQQQGGSGIVMTDGSGNGFLVVDNVPNAESNTYNIGLYDPQLNRGVGRNVGTALNSNIISYDTANKSDFDNSIPPARVDNNNTSASQTSSSGKLEGIVRSSGTANLWSPISRMGVSFRSCNNSLWTNVDENGRFQLSGLTIGATYYAEAMGGCTWSQSGPGKCYEPYRSPSILTNADLCANAPRGLNDFVYLSSIAAKPVYQGGASNLENVRIILNEMAESSGAVKICVKSASGLAIPNATVNFNPDGTPWAKPGAPCVDNNPSNYTFEPGFSNKNFNTGANGCVTAGGLPTGNYSVNVWTPFSNSGGSQAAYNGNGDDFTAWGNTGGGMNWNQAHCSGTGVNDYRVYVETNPALGDNQMLHIYNSSGVLVTDGSVNLSSITYIVPTTVGSTSGKVTGTIKFPGNVDLSNNPIMITLYGQCQDMMGNCPTGNFIAVNGSGASQTYTINVSSGFKYYMNVNAVGWGRVNRGGGDNTINLVSTGTVVVDMEFMQAGQVSGTMYKPDGTVYAPSSSQYIWVDMNNNNGWSGTQLQKDGTFTLPDVLPGVNRVSLYVNSNGSSGSSGTSFDYALPSPSPNVTVVAGSTVTLNINLVDAKYVQPKFTLAKMPESTVVTSGWDQILGFKVVPLSAGSVFNTGTIIKMLTGGDNDNERKFRYSGPTAANQNDTPCGEKWPGGFCAAALPSPSVFDFYLMRSGDFGKMDGSEIADRPYPHFTMVTSSKNVIVNADSSTTDVWSSTNSKYSGILVDLTPVDDLSGRGNARIGGSVIAANFFRQADYDACGGDFDKFVQYLPVMALYREDNGAFAAAGIVVPPPNEISKHDAEFNLNFMQGYTKFRDFLGSLTGGLGYEIRGLAPNKCFTAVLSTPNYPHYQKRVCTGGNATKATLNINLDTAVGAGGTISGVVKSTPTLAVLANAAVELTMEGSETRTAATGADGSYRFDGLSAGVAKVTVTMSSYAVTSAEVSVRGSNAYTQNIYLFNAPGSITGTVYSQKLPFAKVQSGAQIVAYDDTYNGLNQDMPLPLMKTRTGSDGTYKLDGLVTGHTYKVFLKVPGKYTLSVSTPATAGLVSGVDFTMLAKPLDIEVFGRMNSGRQVYEFTVLNPQDFKTGNVIWGESPLNPAAVSTVTMTTLSSGELHGEVDLSLLNPNKTYVLQGAAVSYSGKSVVRELLFGKSYKGNADQHIDDLMLGDDSDDGTGRKNNEAAADRTGDDPSSLVMPAGALITSTGSATVPTCSFKAEDKDNASVSTKTAAADTGATVASNLYTVTLSSVAQTDRPVELTLAYDKTITDTSGLTMKQYNNGTGKWEDASIVPATVNPVKGTITVKLKKLASVLARPGASPQAVFDGKQYVFRAQATGAGTTAGTFAVMNYLGGALPNPNGKLKVFNYPNPFNLKSKAMANNHGATMPATTNGTMIHVEVPAANEGACHIRIYTLAGELVKDISDTCTGGKYNYFAWDGHNSGGQEVANGVYYGVVDLAGKKPDPKNYTFKMVVIK
ncbi:MAG: carboxypeptidase regulatory-like domain-containing protein [Elusimicrobia bacterium]|nr:carboxypeptidase regulatory-like domain-containing protein [Elusimicrobiota bacterium]